MDMDVSPYTEEIPSEPQEQYAAPQDGPPAWFIEHFGHLNAIMEHIEQCQELHGTYIDQLGDNYERTYEQQMALQQQMS